MACKSESREFTNLAGDEVTVFCRQLPATKALDLQIELLNVMGTEVFPFIQGEYDYGNILRVMAATPHDKLSKLMKDVVCMANKDGKEIKSALFDVEYNGELMLVCHVFAFVCEVNFKDFFVAGLAMNAKKPSAEEETSEKVSQ